MATLPEEALSVLKWQQGTLFVIHWALAATLTGFAASVGNDYIIPVDMGFNRWGNTKGGGCSDVSFDPPASRHWHPP